MKDVTYNTVLYYTILCLYMLANNLMSYNLKEMHEVRRVSQTYKMSVKICIRYVATFACTHLIRFLFHI